MRARTARRRKPRSRRAQRALEAKRARDAITYGPAHRKLRDELIAAFIPGTRCAQDFPDGTRCGRRMYLSQGLDLGHTRDKSAYIGLVHASCNRRAAQLWAQWRRANGIVTIRPRIAVRGRRIW